MLYKFVVGAASGSTKSVSKKHARPLTSDVLEKARFRDRVGVQVNSHLVVRIVGSERFLRLQVLLQPSDIIKEASGFHEATFKSIMKCAVDIRKNLYLNVFSSIGSDGLF